jgi:transposase
LEGREREYVIGDKGYDSDPLRNEIRSIGAKPVILSRRTHRIRRPDREEYKLRNVVERFINRKKMSSRCNLLRQSGCHLPGLSPVRADPQATD